MLQGAKLMGGNPDAGRVERDYYATNPKAVDALLDIEPFPNNGDYLEPCVGGGHIANVIQRRFPECHLDAIDIVERGYPGTIVADYITWNAQKEYDAIITNPPYKLASEFITKSLFLLKDNGKLACFLKIQFLEGVKRKKLFDLGQLKYLYVFRKRMDVFANG